MLSKDIIVATSVTDKIGLLDVYERQLAKAGIDLYIDTTSPATSSFNMGMRINYWRSLAEKFIAYKQIIITDGWDVLFFGTKQDLLLRSYDVLISAEKNCFPGPEFGYDDLTDVIKGSTPWKYANPGMVVANPDCLLQWLDKAEKTVDLDISDQAWCNRRLADRLHSVSLDVTTSLFYVISYWDGRLEDSSLQVHEGRLWNSTCNTYPSFFHFAGHGPMEVKRVLHGYDTPRYATMQLIRQYLEQSNEA